MLAREIACWPARPHTINLDVIAAHILVPVLVPPAVMAVVIVVMIVIVVLKHAGRRQIAVPLRLLRGLFVIRLVQGQCGTHAQLLQQPVLKVEGRI